MRSPKLSVILPCYNEIESIPMVLEELLQFKSETEFSGQFAQVQIIVVDDGSTDGSKELLQSFSQIELYSFSQNRGYGAALKQGISMARGDWIGFYDLDCTCHPKDLLKTMDVIEKGDPAMLCGVRLGESTGMPGIRRFGNRLFKATVTMLLGSPVQDACSGYRFFHRDYAKIYGRYLPDQLNFTLAMTVFTLRNEMNYHEFEVNYTERAGQSKLSAFRDGLRFLMTILRYRFSSSLKLT